MYIWLPDWLVALTALALTLHLYFRHKFGHFDRLGVPSSPATFLAGHMGACLTCTRSMADVIKDHYFLHAGKKLYGFFNFTTPMIVLREPEMIKAITVKGFDYFIDRMMPVTEVGDPLFGGNLFGLKGDRWRNMRHTLSPAFTSSKMKSMFVLLEKCGQQLTSHLANKCTDAEDNKVDVEMKDLFTRYTNDVIATAAFGVAVDSLAQPDNSFYAMGKESADFGGRASLVFMGYTIMADVMTYFRIPFFTSRVSTFFRELIVGTIKTREREGIVRPDMIHLLMEARKGTLKSDEDDVNLLAKNIGQELSDDQVTAQAVFFFLAGFDTSSTLLSFTCHLLAKHPDVQAKLRDEIQTTIRDNDEQLTYNAVQSMTYLDQVISESLRLWPPGFVLTRECVKPYLLPATESSPEIRFRVGDWVTVPVFGLHRDPEHYPNPDDFDPERFSDENKSKIKPFTYLPFGVGPRNCIGMRFALLEAKIAVAHLLAKFDLEVSEKTPREIRLKKKNFVLDAEGGFWLKIKARLS